MIRSANLTASVSRNAGGLFDSVRRLVQSLQSAGNEMCVFGIEDEHTAVDIGAWAPVPVKAFPARWPKTFGYSPEFIRQLEEFTPDLTHTHGLWGFASVAVNRYHSPRGTPYIISAHGMLDPWALENSHWKKAIAYFLYEERHLHEAACLRALCEPEARAIRQLGLKNPIAIVPNGIDIPEIRTPAGSDALSPAARQSLASSQRKVLLYLGRIHPKKGLVNLLHAWAATCKQKGGGKMEEWILAIAGWDQGGHEAQLKQIASDLGISFADIRDQEMRKGNPGIEGEGQRMMQAGRWPEFQGHPSVIFLGPQFGAGKAACYANCDAFILPSFSEGVPLVILEAWAYGKPVLMTPECNLPIAFDCGAALRIEPNVPSIGRGLCDLFQAQEPALSALGANGLQLARQRFSWPSLAKEMTELYHWVLGGGTKPACIADY